MTYLQTVYLHLATVLPAFVIGTALLARRKGTPVHRRLGRIYGVLMLSTAVVALFIPAHVGPTLWGHFGWIHALCIVVIVSVPRAVLAARRGDIATHRSTMIALYVGALLVAGVFTLAPGRMIHRWLFGATGWS